MSGDTWGKDTWTDEELHKIPAEIPEALRRRHEEERAEADAELRRLRALPQYRFGAALAAGQSEQGSAMDRRELRAMARADRELDQLRARALEAQGRAAIAGGERSLSKGGDVDPTRFAEAQLGKSAGPPGEAVRQYREEARRWREEVEREQCCGEAALSKGAVEDTQHLRWPVGKLCQLEGWTPGKEEGLTAGCAADAAEGRRQYEEGRAMLSNTCGAAPVVATVREQVMRLCTIVHRLQELLGMPEEKCLTVAGIEGVCAAEQALLEEIAALATWADRLDHAVSVVERLVKLIR